MNKYCQLLLLVPFLFISCHGDKKVETRKPSSRGLPSELLLVVDRDFCHEQMTTFFKEIFQRDVPGLYQSEPFFRLSRVPLSHYTRRYVTLHSQVFVRRDRGLKQVMLNVSRDVTARPQIVMDISAPDEESLCAYLTAHADSVCNLICDAQLDMRAADLRRHYNVEVRNRMGQQLGYTICVPEHLHPRKEASSFLWAGTNLQSKDLNVVLYSFPWESGRPLDLVTFAHKRDSVMKANLSGSTSDKYMQTTWQDGRPLLSASLLRCVGKTDVMHVRGFWEMKNDGFGGPFVADVLQDKDAGRLLVAEGFVFSPSTGKRDLIRILEASLRTVKKINDKN